MSKFKPMKPPTGTLDINTVRFPCYASIKYDGFRVAVREGRTVLNSLRELDNVYTRTLLACPEMEGYDGELVILPLNDNKCFNRCQSAFRAAKGEPDFRFVVFDRIAEGSFKERWVEFNHPDYPEWVMVDRPVLIETREQLDAFVEAILADGHEGVILRDPEGAYIFGRATFKNQTLLRIKPMETDEIRITGFICEYANTNTMERDNRGYAKRSSAKDGKVAKDTLGKLIGISEKWGEVVVSGFDDATADEVWRNKEKYLGEYATYTYQAIGSIDKPRIAKFKGFRFAGDMSV